MRALPIAGGDLSTASLLKMFVSNQPAGIAWEQHTSTKAMSNADWNVAMRHLHLIPSRVMPHGRASFVAMERSRAVGLKGGLPNSAKRSLGSITPTCATPTLSVSLGSRRAISAEALARSPDH